MKKKVNCRIIIYCELFLKSDLFFSTHRFESSIIYKKGSKAKYITEMRRSSCSSFHSFFVKFFFFLSAMHRVLFCGWWWSALFIGFGCLDIHWLQIFCLALGMVYLICLVGVSFGMISFSFPLPFNTYMN